MANEKRLIDAHAVVDGIVAQLENEWGYDGIREDVLRIFDSAPTVDAVEVVRCKDCKYRYTPNSPTGKPFCTEQFGMQAKDEDFCSYGERREGE